MGNAFDSANYPSREPEQLVAGDRWTWKRSDLSGMYPPADFSLSYTADKEGAGATQIQIAATVSGSEFVVEVASATTATYVAGRYRWQAYITRLADSQRISVASGSFEVRPNLAASTADPRSHVKKVLDAIEAIIEQRATMDQMSYSIQGRTLARTPINDLLVLRDRYRAEYQRELNAERLNKGLRPRNRLLTRL